MTDNILLVKDPCCGPISGQRCDWWTKSTPATPSRYHLQAEGLTAANKLRWQNYSFKKNEASPQWPKRASENGPLD